MIAAIADLKGALEASVYVGTLEQRMREASTDEMLSNICRDIEARLDVENVPTEVREAFEALRVKHTMRLYVGARAG